MTNSNSSSHASPLSALEARVLGALIEKELTTPEVYPLTINSLVNACNQRNNRAPLFSVGPQDVEIALEQLRLKRLAVLFSGADARVPKFRQTLDNVYPVDLVARALLAELLLRGPQTAAELRARAERMTPMPSATEIEGTLMEFAQRPEGKLAVKLPRQPGQKEARWAHLLGGEPVLTEPSPEAFAITATLPPEAERRLAHLEATVATLQAELASLRTALGGS